MVVSRSYFFFASTNCLQNPLHIHLYLVPCAASPSYRSCNVFQSHWWTITHCLRSCFLSLPIWSRILIHLVLQMAHLLSDPSSNVQRMAYDMLRVAAKKRTEYLIIEAGVDTDSTVQCELPMELLSLLRQPIDGIDIESIPSSVRSCAELVPALGFIICCT